MRRFLSAVACLAAPAGLLLACTPAPVAPPPAAVPAAPPIAAVRAAPAPLAPPEQAMDARAVTAAQQNLKLLGYDVGKPGGTLDPATRKAIQAFQKDQGLAPDGRLTVALADRLKQLRGELSKATIVPDTRGDIFVYADGTVRASSADLLTASANGLVADVSPSFLQSLRPGAREIYHLGHRAKDGGFTAAATVTCKAGHIEQINVPAALFDAIPDNCSAVGKGLPPAQWRWFYAAKLGQVVRQEGISGPRFRHDLVAIRPSTAGWPSAARMGLDWALTSALETPPSAAPVQWSSTGVAQQFEIHVSPPLSPGDAGLNAAGRVLCRRFEMTDTDNPAHLYPGIACKDAKGAWSLPGSRIRLASPASGLGDRATLADGG